MHFSQESSVRNLDIHELDYNPCKKDMTDAKIHHLLTEELKPRRVRKLLVIRLRIWPKIGLVLHLQHRRLSYSRHTVDDRDLTTPVNYKVQIHIRRLLNDPKHHHHHHHHHRRSKRGSGDKETNSQLEVGPKVENHVSFPEFQENGLAKQLSDDYIYEVMHDAEQEEEEGEGRVVHEEEEEELTNNSLSRKSTIPSDWDDGLTFIAKGSSEC